MSKTTRITIPATIEEAVSSLNGLGALLTAKEWERAAIVRAFCQKMPTGNGAAREAVRVEMPEYAMPIKVFASLGIAGLRNYQTVLAYYTAWESTGLPVPKPGAKVVLPDEPFPASRYEGRTEKEMAAVRRTLAKPERRAELITALVTEHGAEVLAALPETDKDRFDTWLKEREPVAPARGGAINEPLPMPTGPIVRGPNAGPYQGSTPERKARIAMWQALDLFVEALGEIEEDAAIAFADDKDGELVALLDRAVSLLAAIQERVNARHLAAV